jgi:5-dehydro-4-deoxyglucarate dehydratase
MRRYVIPLYALRARRKGYEVTVMKEMMNRAGLAAGPVRPPLPSLRPEELAEIDAIIKEWNAVLSSEALVS